MTDPSPPDIRAVIEADLDATASGKRRHFAPAVVLAVAVVGLLFSTMGIRPDLLLQPAWQVAVRAATWIVCLIAFPAVGVGLWFPSRNGRIGLAMVGAVLAVLAATGWPPTPGTAGATEGPCMMLVGGTAILFFGVGALSGAFAQRRAASSVFWIASGIGLCSLAAITWVCPNSTAAHVLQMHVGPAAGIAAVVVALGVWLHGRSRSGPRT